MADATNIRAMSDGALYLADQGTANVENPATSPGASWVDYGYVTADGLAEVFSVDTNEIVEGFSGTTVRKPKTKETRDVKVAFLEQNEAVLELYYGSTLTDGGAYVLLDLVPLPTAQFALIFDSIDGSTTTRRYLHTVEVNEREDVTHKAGEAESYGVTFTAYASAGTFGKLSQTDVGWALTS